MEHEVSIMSARTVLDAVSKIPTFEPRLLIVTKEGRILCEDESKKALLEGAAVRGGDLSFGQRPLSEMCDVVFPLIYDWNGLGGSSQLLAEISGVPYIGSGPLANAILVDKPLTKTMISALGIPQVRYIAFSRDEYTKKPDDINQQAATLTLPLFVKPASLGSSVGISKVDSYATLSDAVRDAFRYDRRVMVEEGVHDARELEVAIIGTQGTPRASPGGEIRFKGDFWGYQMKYTLGGSQFYCPADIPKTLSDDIQKYALEIYKLLDCNGFARFDFFWDPKSGDLYFNEGTSNPGLTPNSALPKLVAAMGIDWVEFVENLVFMAQDRHIRAQEY